MYNVLSQNRRDVSHSMREWSQSERPRGRISMASSRSISAMARQADGCVIRLTPCVRRAKRHLALASGLWLATMVLSVVWGSVLLLLPHVSEATDMALAYAVQRNLLAEHQYCVYSALQIPTSQRFDITHARDACGLIADSVTASGLGQAAGT